MRILVTGGAGFVGSNIAIEFKKNKKNLQLLAFGNIIVDQIIEEISGWIKEKSELLNQYLHKKEVLWR